jgi:hypothetical protein
MTTTVFKISFINYTYVFLYFPKQFWTDYHRSVPVNSKRISLTQYSRISRRCSTRHTSTRISKDRSPNIPPRPPPTAGQPQHSFRFNNISFCYWNQEQDDLSVKKYRGRDLSTLHASQIIFQECSIRVRRVLFRLNFVIRPDLIQT